MRKKLGILFAIVSIGFMASTALATRITQRQKITSTPRGVGAQFGNAVAIDRRWMIVGAPNDSTVASQQGAAYVFAQGVDGIWGQVTILRAPDGAPGDKFGISVAIYGAYFVVGAFNADAPLSNSGAVYFFSRCGEFCWTPGIKVTPNDAAADDQFGSSVAVDINGTITVGANHADLPGNSEAGAVYRFADNDGVWTQVQKLTPMAPVVLGNHFGDSMALNGNKLVVGASGDNTPQTGAGAVYVFADNGSSYSLEQKLTIADGTNGDQFGFSVAIDGNTIVGGAKEDSTVVGQTGIGAAYVFSFNGAAWSQQQKLMAPDGLGFDRFGYSVAVSGDTVAVGAREDDTAAGGDTGSAYLFTRTGGVWTEKQKLLPADSINGDRFGVSAAFGLNGQLVVGAAEKALTNPNGQGAVYTFDLPRVLFDYDGDLKSDISVFRPSNGAWYLQRSTTGLYGTLFGFSTDKITPADYDGDGKTDIAVYRPETGIWYVFNSGNGTVSYYQFGLSEDLPTPADYDGDGKADISVFRPSTGTWYRQNSSDGSFHGIQFGASEDKPTVGDFDGDGKADIAVFRPSTGAWYRINSLDGSLFGELFGFGSDILVPADYDGDGKTDLAVFRPSTGIWYLKNSSDASYVYNVFGLPDDIPAPGDFDGDGKADLSVFRPSDGNWYRQNSSDGSFTAFPFGANGDKPTMTAFRY